MWTSIKCTLVTWVFTSSSHLLKFNSHLQVFDKVSGKATGGKGCVDALRGEVVQLLEVGIHHDLFLVGVLERLHTREGAVLTRDDVHAAAQTAFYKDTTGCLFLKGCGGTVREQALWAVAQS